MATRVFKYWCEPASSEDANVLHEQFRLEREYRWLLADYENAAREDSHQDMRRDPDYAKASDQVDTLLETEVEERDEAWRDQLDTWSDERKRAYTSNIKGQDWWRGLSAERAVLLRDFMREGRKIMGPNGRGLSFGSYQDAEDHHKQAVEKTAIYRRIHVSSDHSALTCHLQNEDAVQWRLIVAGGCRLVQVGQELYGLASTGPQTHDQSTRYREPSRTSGAQKMQRVTLQVRKGVRVSMHTLLHRAIPDESKISHVRVHGERIGRRTRYSLQIVATVPEPCAPERLDTQSHVGVDIGWRATPTGYRVAYAVGSDGTHHELMVPYAVGDRAIERHQHKDRCSTLRATRDLNLNIIKQTIAAQRTGAPEWFRQDTQAIHMFRSSSRIVRLWRRWKDRRFEGDAASFDALLAWRKQDEHLWDWEASNRKKMRREIDGRYQEFASRLAKLYDVIKIEDLRVGTAKDAWREHVESEFENGERFSKELVSDRRSALAPAHLQRCLRERGATFGASVGEVKAAYTSRTCSACGHVGPASSQQLLTCHACGLVEDRDTRAAKNISSAEVHTWLAGPLAAPKSTKRKLPRRRREPQRAAASI